MGAGSGGDFGVAGKKSLAEEEEDDEDWTSGDASAIFAPTARLAAPIYKHVVMFSDLTQRVLLDEGVNQGFAADASGSGVGSSYKGVGMGAVGAVGGAAAGAGAGAGQRQSWVPKTVLQLQQQQQWPERSGSGSVGSSIEGGRESKVLTMVHTFLEEELMPVVQVIERVASIQQ